MNIHVLYGNEPYLVDKYCQKYINGLQNPDLNLARFTEWGTDVISFLQLYPILDAKRVAIVSIDSLKLLGKDFATYLNASSQTAELVMVVKDMDKRLSLYKQLQKDGMLVECNKLSDPEMLKKILLLELKNLGGQIREDAYELFLQREQYLEIEDINLYNLISDLKRLVSYDTTISTETVYLLVNETVVEQIFEISKMIQAKDISSLRKQADALAGDEIKTLCALLREYRIAWKAKYYKLSQIGVRYASLSKLPKDYLVSGMKIIMSAIDGMKNGSMPKESALMYTFLQLITLQHDNIMSQS